MDPETDLQLKNTEIVVTKSSGQQRGSKMITLQRKQNYSHWCVNISLSSSHYQTWNLSKTLHRRIFRLKILHCQFHLILTVLVRKNTKMSENGEIYTAGKNFTLPPAVTNPTSGVGQLKTKSFSTTFTWWQNRRPQDSPHRHWRKTLRWRDCPRLRPWWTLPPGRR